MSLISESGEYAEMTTKIRTNSFLAEHSMTGKQELFLYFSDLKHVFEEANTAESVRELTIPRQESGKDKNRFEFQPLEKGDQEKTPHKLIQLS